MISCNPPESVTDAKPWSQQDNMALRLLRWTVGGDDRFGVVKGFDFGYGWCLD